MSDQNEDLSPDELNALLRELEGRSGGGPERVKGASPAAEEDTEDLEAFLRSLEESDEEASRSPPKTAVRDEQFDAQFAELEEADQSALEPQPKEDKPAAKEKALKDKKQRSKKKKKEIKEVALEQGEGSETASKSGKEGKQRAWRIMKWVGIVLPALCLWWVSGAYLGNWVSAGWLITVVGAVFVFGLPALLKHWVRRGRYAHWLAGASALLLLGLIAPMPQQAGVTLAEYGHWPGSAVGELAGWPADHGLIRGSAALSQVIGGVLTSQARDQSPYRLGTEIGLRAIPAVEAVSETPEPESAEPAPQSE